MYRCILVTVENSPIDQTILAHVEQLAIFSKASVVLTHVADGFVARNQEALNLADSEEIKADRDYLETCRQQLAAKGIAVSAVLETGEPAEKILEVADKHQCDLIAMATHGHRFVADVLLGSVSSSVRHKANVPVLLIRAGR